MSLFPSAKELADKFGDKLVEKLPDLKAAGLDALQQFARTNVIHIDITDDDSGFHAAVSFTPKGT